MENQVRSLSHRMARELSQEEIGAVSGGMGSTSQGFGGGGTGCPGPSQGTSPTGAAITRCQHTTIENGVVIVLRCDDDFRGNP